MTITGTCHTCHRENVSLMSRQPDANCSVCHRLQRVAVKITAGSPLTESDKLTIHRVLQAHRDNRIDSVEATVAAKMGYITLFERPQGVTAAPAEDEWPRQVVAWKCSDGSLHLDEEPALAQEFRLLREHKKAA